MRALRSLALIAVASIAQTRTADAQAVERRTTVARDVSVRIWLPAGTLRLIGWDRDMVVVTGTVAPGETFFHGGDSRALKFGVEEPPAGREAQPSQLTAYIPRSGRVSVRTSSASIEASDLAGAYSSLSGAIRLSGSASDVQADAVDGNVSVNVTAGMVRARSGGGTVSVDGSIEDLGAATVSGDLTVTSRDLITGRLESMTGAIVFIGDFFAKGGSVEIDNHAGLVDLRLAPAPVNLEVTSVAGTISNGISKVPISKTQTKMGDWLSIGPGTGWPKIVVRSFKGEVIVRPR
jgi:hypothetical protein